VNFDGRERLRCFFTIDTSLNNTFDYFVRPSGHRPPAFLFVYTNESIQNESAWIKTKDPISKQPSSLPIFFSVANVSEYSQWALNINFSTTNPELSQTCIFKQARIFDGVNFSAPENANLDYQTQCEIPSSVKMWMYLMYTFYAWAFLLVIVGVGYCQFRKWQREEAPITSSALSQRPTPYRSLFASPMRMLGDELA
jgi:hypothetical protein